MSAAVELARTPIYDWHAAHGGKLVDFAGWAMPIRYDGQGGGSIVDEHNATRQAAGLFDVSHMGRLLISGEGAEDLLDKTLTRRTRNLNLGAVRYSLVCNEAGGVLDDVLAYRVKTPGSDAIGFGMVVNASNREKIVGHLQEHAKGIDVSLEDATHDYAMLAVQGPRAIELLDPVTSCELTAMRYYTGQVTDFELADGRRVECFLSRTGYTGEDGCEIICPAADAAAVWERVIALIEPEGGRAVGLAARDTLRLEAGMPLYGHELTEAINPLQAGLNFAVNLKDRDFIGAAAIAESANDHKLPTRIGLTIEGRRAAREGATVLQGDEPVGTVTSGTFSPTLGQPIAMAYVKPSAAAVGDHLAVDIRGKEAAATVAPLPFYERGR